jgi:hypothetical protein
MLDDELRCGKPEAGDAEHGVVRADPKPVIKTCPLRGPERSRGGAGKEPTQPASTISAGHRPARSSRSHARGSALTGLCTATVRALDVTDHRGNR